MDRGTVLDLRASTDIIFTHLNIFYLSDSAFSATCTKIIRLLREPHDQSPQVSDTSWEQELP